jgi:hypothetical protein
LAISAIPALPGAQKSAPQVGDSAIAQHNACSRPPDPTTRIFIASPDPRLASARDFVT